MYARTVIINQLLNIYASDQHDLATLFDVLKQFRTWALSRFGKTNGQIVRRKKIWGKATRWHLSSKGTGYQISPSALPDT